MVTFPFPVIFMWYVLLYHNPAFPDMLTTYIPERMSSSLLLTTGLNESINSLKVIVEQLECKLSVEFRTQGKPCSGVSASGTIMILCPASATSVIVKDTIHMSSSAARDIF